jgi:hypothetical protein
MLVGEDDRPRTAVSTDAVAELLEKVQEDLR